MTSSSDLADSLARAAAIGLEQEADAAKYVTEHHWWFTWRGRVDEWHAFEKEWEPGMPHGSGATQAEAIADLEAELLERVRA